MEFGSGWIPPEDRTENQHAIHGTAIDSMPVFSAFKFGAPDNARKSNNVIMAKKANGGKWLPTLNQNSNGSCVEQGRTNAGMYTSAIEVYKGERERVIIPNMFHGYGWTRKFSGMGEGRGEGAMGSGAAQCAREKGYVALGECPELPNPKPKDNEGQDELYWDPADQNKYSTMRAVPESANALGGQHLIAATSPVRTWNDLKTALLQNKVVTVASNRGFSGSLGKSFGTVKHGKRWGVPGGQWNHQMIFLDVDDDPQYPGALCDNSWGAWAMGVPEDETPPGSFWVDAETCEYMVSQNDSFAYFGLAGYSELVVLPSV